MPDDSKNTGEQEWPRITLVRGEPSDHLTVLNQTIGAWHGEETETYVPLHSIWDRLLSDEAVEALAAKEFAWAIVAKGAMPCSWEDCGETSKESWRAKARFDLEAALQAAFPKEESE